jgi:hypothetical protein
LPTDATQMTSCAMAKFTARISSGASVGMLKLMFTTFAPC